jgi:hypothetical protein
MQTISIPFLQMMIVQEPASVLGAWFGGDDFCAVRHLEKTTLDPWPATPDEDLIHWRLI